MNSNCERIRDQISDFVTGILPDTEIRKLEQHLSECSGCRDYAQALREEDELLAGLFAEFDAGMKGRMEETIRAINDFDRSGQGMISVGAEAVRSFLARHATAAAVVAVVTLYFAVTLSWISQIRECIEPFENLLTQRACM